MIGLPLIPFWGVWAEKYSRKMVIVRSSYVEALMFGLAAVSQNVWMLAAARFLSGLVVGNTGVMFAVQADRTPADRLGLAISFISAAPPVGMAVGPYLGSLVIGAAGIRALLGLDAGLCLCAGLAMTWWLRDRRLAAPSTASTRVMVRDSLAALRASPLVVRLFALSFLAALGGAVSVPYAPILIAALWRGPHVVQGIGLVLTAAGILLAVGTPLWGRLGDTWGHQRCLRLSTGVGALTMAAQAAAAALPPFVLFRCIQSLFGGGIGAMSTTLIARGVPPERRASILNFSLMPMQISWFLGPLLGAAVSAIGGIHLVFWLAAMASGGAFLLAGGSTFGTPAKAAVRSEVSTA